MLHGLEHIKHAQKSTLLGLWIFGLMGLIQLHCKKAAGTSLIGSWMVKKQETLTPNPKPSLNLGPKAWQNLPGRREAVVQIKCYFETQIENCK
jgi:hypothetical protein